jgi:hypothetical protein
MCPHCGKITEKQAKDQCVPMMRAPEKLREKHFSAGASWAVSGTQMTEKQKDQRIKLTRSYIRILYFCSAVIAIDR